MFRRLLLDDASAWFTMVALITAVTVFVSILWQALRMSRRQITRFANLPFNDPTSPARDESRS